MDGLDDTWGGSHTSRVFAVGVALGGLVGLLLGSAIGISLGQRSAQALRHLIVDALRRGDRVDFELLAQ